MEVKRADTPTHLVSNFYDGRLIVQRSKKRHIYKVIADSSNQWVGYKPYSVTTITKVVNKPKLNDWVVKTALDIFYEKIQAVSDLSLEKLKQLKEESFKERFKIRDAAGNYGTKCHNAIEEYCKYLLCGGEPSFEEFNKEIQFVMQNLEGELIGSEILLFNPRLGYAGTLDLLTKLDNNNYRIYDIKTGKGIYDEYDWQVAAYSETVKTLISIFENKSVQVHGTILHLPQNGEFDVIETDMELDKFHACLALRG